MKFGNLGFSIVNFIALPYFSVFRSYVKSHGALSHDSIDQLKLADGNGGHERCTTVKYLDGLYRRHYELLSKFNVGLKSLLHQGLSEPEFYGD